MQKDNPLMVRGLDVFLRHRMGPLGAMIQYDHDAASFLVSAETFLRCLAILRELGSRP